MTRVYISTSSPKSNLLFAPILRDLVANSGVRLRIVNDAWSVESMRSRLTAIGQADLLLAFTDVDNAPVMFDIGYATALKIPVVVVSGDVLPIPDFLRELVYVLPITQRTYQEFVDEFVNVVHKTKSVRELSPRLSDEYAFHDEPINWKSHKLFERDHNFLESSLIDEVTSLLLAQGCIVTRAPMTRDAGYDLLVRNYKGHKETIVQVKQSTGASRISVGHVMALADAIRASSSDSGILITDSDFTASARELARTVPYEIELLTLRQLQEMTPGFLAGAKIGIADDPSPSVTS